MRISLLLLFIILPTLLSAQASDSVKVIGIHPAVGKSISRNEKIQYKLFPQYKNESFEQAEVLKLNDSTFVLAVKPVNGNSIKCPITIAELDELFYQIDKPVTRKKPLDDDYVKELEERKEAEKTRAKNDNSEFWWNFLTQMTIITFETLIAIGLTN
ncbi:MAG: hypothetical protein K0S44_1620 [Bacteroidetes bacterium]|jgi:ATP-dependent Zn protease|nr:hypothetical protein [Bacteroidota bacterium]